MTPIRKILFPIDFSERCTSAAAHVKLWAEHLSASIVSLHVVDPKNYFAKDDRSEDTFWEHLPSYIDKRTRDLDYFCTRYLDGPQVSKVVLGGDTALQIVALAESEKVELVMLPRDHQSLGSRWLHDSLTAQVLNDCPAAVWTSEHVSSLPVRPLKHVLCAIHVADDLSLDAAMERMLQFLRAICTGFGASATCLFVGNSEETHLGKVMRRSGGSLAIAERLSQIRHDIFDIADFETGSGRVADAIHEAAVRTNSDLIVLGRTRPFTAGLGLQQHILSVDHRAGCPVISIF